jgi:hypothetical protein
VPGPSSASINCNHGQSSLNLAPSCLSIGLVKFRVGRAAYLLQSVCDLLWRLPKLEVPFAVDFVSHNSQITFSVDMGRGSESVKVYDRGWALAEGGGLRTHLEGVSEFQRESVERKAGCRTVSLFNDGVESRSVRVDVAKISIILAANQLKMQNMSTNAQDFRLDGPPCILGCGFIVDQISILCSCAKFVASMSINDSSHSLRFLICPSGSC